MDDTEGNWTHWSNGSAYPINPIVHAVQVAEAFVSPVVCLVGTLLNLMAVGAFLSKPLRRISCCLYLATRSLAVFGFLVSMATHWSNAFIDPFGMPGVCQFTVFLSFMCTFISAWMVVAISLENFIRIAQPQRVSTLCTPRVAKVVIACFCVIGIIINNFSFWTTKAAHRTCDHLPEYIKIVLIWTSVDTILTLVIPLGLLFVLVPWVALLAFHSFDRKKRLAAGRTTRPGSQESTPEAKVTHLLLAVSVVFLMLHAPFQVIRFKIFLSQFTNEWQLTLMEASLHLIFRLFYNLDSCVSCIVYLVFGDNFRRVFINMYFSRCRRGWCKLRRSMRGGRTAIEISNVDDASKFRSTSIVSNSVLLHSTNSNCNSRSGSYNNINGNNTQRQSENDCRNLYTQLNNGGGICSNTTATSASESLLSPTNTGATNHSALLSLRDEEKEFVELPAAEKVASGVGGAETGSVHRNHSNLVVSLSSASSSSDQCNGKVVVSLVHGGEYGDVGGEDFDDGDVGGGDGRGVCGGVGGKENGVGGVVEDDGYYDEEVDLLDAEDEEKQTKRGLLSSESVDV